MPSSVFPKPFPPMSRLGTRPVLFGNRPQQPVVVVVDQFKGKTTDIDGDGIPDVSHGRLVVDYLRSWLPGYEIRKLEGHRTSLAFQRSLEKIARWIDAGLPVKAVNVSIGSAPFYLRESMRQSGLPLNHKRLGNTPEAFRQWLEDVHRTIPQLNREVRRIVSEERKIIKSHTNKRQVLREINRMDRQLENISAKQILVQNILGVMYGMEAIVQRGVPVYTSAGNHVVNLFGFSKGAVNVGSLDPAGKLSDFSVSHSQVAHYIQGEFPVAEVWQQGKLIGLDTVGDGKAHFRLHELSDKHLGKPLASLLAPPAIMEDIKHLIQQGKPNLEVPEPLQQYVIPAAEYKAWRGDPVEPPLDYYVGLRPKLGKTLPYAVDALGNLHLPPHDMPKVTGTSFAVPNFIRKALGH